MSELGNIFGGSAIGGGLTYLLTGGNMKETLAGTAIGAGSGYLLGEMFGNNNRHHRDYSDYGDYGNYASGGGVGYPLGGFGGGWGGGGCGNDDMMMMLMMQQIMQGGLGFPQMNRGCCCCRTQRPRMFLSMGVG